MGINSYNTCWTLKRGEQMLITQVCGSYERSVHETEDVNLLQPQKATEINASFKAIDQF